MSRISLADLPETYQRQVVDKLAAQVPALKKPSKYRNQPTEFASVQGFSVRADSKLEACMFAELDLRLKAGEVAWWEPHVRFRLPDGDVYECDALVAERARGVRVLDAKGKETREFQRKARLMQKHRGITVELWRAA